MERKGRERRRKREWVCVKREQQEEKKKWNSKEEGTRASAMAFEGKRAQIMFHFERYIHVKQHELDTTLSYFHFEKAGWLAVRMARTAG